MPEISGWGILALVVGSGGLSGLASAGVNLWDEGRRQKRQLEADSEGQRQERAHQILLERMRQHDEARKALLPCGIEAHRALEELNYWIIGPDVGVVDPEGTTSEDPFSVAQRVLNLVRKIEVEHPTENVRRVAEQLKDKLRHFYGEAPQYRHPDEPFPSAARDRDELLEHERLARRIIELMHATDEFLDAPTTERHQ